MGEARANGNAGQGLRCAAAGRGRDAPSRRSGFIRRNSGGVDVVGGGGRPNDGATMLPAVELLIKEVRALCAASMPFEERWTAVAGHMRTLLADPELREHARGWPTSPALLGLQGKHANLLFYEDPDYGFVLNGLIKPANARTTIHDHGRSVTLYGVITGAEKVVRYAVSDAVPLPDSPEAGLLSRARVVVTDEADVGPGHIDYIRPWEVHAEVNGGGSTAALILRSQRSGTFVQNIFDAESGTVEQYHGPRQIAYALG
jgi:hypothetical protein